MTRRTLIALPFAAPSAAIAALAPARQSTADSPNPDDWDPRDFPEHWWQCKDEDEEAKWWYANRDKLDRYFEENPVQPIPKEWFDRACARDLRDIEAAIEKNAGKPLTDWEQAKKELDI
jgi:hypothetical protein